MNKKIFLFFVLSLISNNLLYGEDNTEKIIRKNNSIFRMVDNKLIKLDNAAITIKLREGKVLSKNVKTIRSNKLGYIDIEVPNDLDIEDYVAYLKSKGSTFTIDTTGWESGIYVIRANVGDRELIQKVLVK